MEIMCGRSILHTDLFDSKGLFNNQDLGARGARDFLKAVQFFIVAQGGTDLQNKMWGWGPKILENVKKCGVGVKNPVKKLNFEGKSETRAISRSRTDPSIARN